MRTKLELVGDGVVAAAVVAFAAILFWSTSLGLFLAKTWSDWVPLLMAIPLGICLARVRPARAWMAGRLGRIPLWAIVGAGLLLRVTWAVASDWVPVSDAIVYDQMAGEILQGNFAPNAMKPKGTSYFLALHYALLGHSYLPPMITQAALSAAQLWLVHDIVLAACGFRSTAKAAAALLAIWPEHLLYVDVLGSDTIFSFLVLFAVWFIRGRSDFRFWPAVAAGFTLGCSQWMRPTGLLFIVTACVAVAAVRLRDGTARIAVRQAVALAAGACVPVGLIVWLNVASFGIASPSPALMGGFSMLVGTNLDVDGAYNKPDALWFSEELAGVEVPAGIHPAVYRDRLAKQRAWDRISAQPVEFITCALTAKMYSLWGLPATLSWPLFSSSLAKIMTVQWVMAVATLHYAIAAFVLVVCAGRTVRQAATRSPALLMLVAAAVLTTATHVFLEVQPRYHFAFVPMWSMLLALGLFTDPAAAGDPEEPFTPLRRS